jgi:predicted nucleic acid-binding protein
MNVLVDSPIWVGHFKQRNDHLSDLLESGRVLCHPYVVTEIACGTPPRRKHVLTLLSDMPSLPVATQAELLGFVENRALYGRGCGLVDIALLASALLRGQTLLWTADKRLAALAASLGCLYRPPLPV